MRDVNCEGNIGRCVLEPAHSSSSPSPDQMSSVSPFDTTTAYTPLRRARKQATPRRRPVRPRRRKVQVGGSRKRARVNKSRRRVQVGGSRHRRAAKRRTYRR